MMTLWPAGFMQLPSRRGWETAPFDTRASFDPEVGPPLFRARVTAESWSARATFPLATEAERAAFLAFWEETGRGALPFLWRDPDGGGAARKWMFAAGEPLRISKVEPTRWDISVSLIRLPSAPWWAALIPPDRLVAPVAAYDFRRGLYHNGIAQVGLDTAITFSRASTATRVGSGGLVESMAINLSRIDHWPLGGSRRGLLKEAAQMNRCLQSQQFDDAAWDKFLCSVTANAAGGPGGATDADKVVPNSGAAANTAGIQQSVAIAAASSVALSIWVKSASLRANVQVQARNVGDAIIGSGLATIALDGATISASSITGFTASAWRIEAHAGGWTRVIFEGVTPVATVEVRLVILSPDAGDGSKGILVWGSQVEGIARASSYIPTTGGPVTRAADVAGLAVAHGACDLRLTYDDDSVETLLNQTLTAGWWPAMARPHIASIAVFAAGALA